MKRRAFLAAIGLAPAALAVGPPEPETRYYTLNWQAPKVTRDEPADIAQAPWRIHDMGERAIGCHVPDVIYGRLV